MTEASQLQPACGRTKLWLSMHWARDEGKVWNEGNREEARRWVWDERGNGKLELAGVWKPKGRVLPFLPLSPLTLFPLPIFLPLLGTSAFSFFLGHLDSASKSSPNTPPL